MTMLMLSPLVFEKNVKGAREEVHKRSGSPDDADASSDDRIKETSDKTATKKGGINPPTFFCASSSYLLSIVQ